MLSFQTRDANGVLVLTAEETEGTEGERPSALRERLYEAIEAHADPRFVIDLGALHYMTSGDIGFLITLKRRIEGRRGKVVLFGLDPYVQDILRSMKLLPLFEVASSLDDALARLSAGPAS